jgi:hypothetical protein
MRTYGIRARGSTPSCRVIQVVSRGERTEGEALFAARHIHKKTGGRLGVGHGYADVLNAA